MIDVSMLDEFLESILFVSGNGLKVEELAGILEIKKSDINAAVARLKEKYGGKSGIHLISYNGKIQFASNPEYSDVVAAVLNPIRERDLSNAALETIAIIAYRQPVTRLDIEQIRGVSSEYCVQLLLKNNLIEVVGQSARRRGRRKTQHLQRIRNSRRGSRRTRASRGRGSSRLSRERKGPRKGRLKLKPE